MNAIEEMARLLDANGAPGGIERHRQFVAAQFARFSTMASNQEYPTNVVPAVFGYLLNHHYFDIESHEKLSVLMDVAFEVICPVATDDERSAAYLDFLAQRLQLVKR